MEPSFAHELEVQLRTLAAAAKRKLPMVKETAERAIVSLRGASGAGGLEISSDALADELLQPLILTCNHKSATPKLVSLALGAVQKLASHVPLGAVQLRNVVRVLAIQASSVNQTTKLRILQTLPLLATTSVEGGESAFFHTDSDSVVQALTICFFMQSSSDDHIIASTAHFTLRQLTTMLFDTIALRHPLAAKDDETAVDGDGAAEAEQPWIASENEMRVADADGARERAEGELEGPVRVGMLLFSDLCTFADGQTGEWLRGVEPSKHLAFELLQSIVVTQARLFARIPEFGGLMRRKLFPLLVTTLRCATPMDARIVVSVSKLVTTICTAFVSCFTVECEMLLTVVAGVLAPARAVELAQTRLGLWHLICVLETLRALIAVPRLTVVIYEIFDGSPVRGSTTVFRGLAKSLGRFAQVALDLPTCDGVSLAGAARLHRTRRSNAFNPFKGLPSSGERSNERNGGLPSDGAAAAPPPEMVARLVLITAQCLIDMAQSVAAACDAIERGAAADASPRSPATPRGASPVLTLSAADAVAKQTLRGVTDALWQPLLSTLATVLEHVADEELTQMTLKSYQSFTKICGDLDLVQPRDAFLASLCSAALPHLTYPSSDMKVTPPVRTITNSAAMTLMEGGGADRYMHPLKALLNIAHCLGNHLGSSWHLVLHALQQLASILPRLAGSSALRERDGPSPVANDQVGEIDIVADALERLFESTRYLDNGALMHVARALEELARESIAEAAQFAKEDATKRMQRGVSGGRGGIASFVRQRAMHGLGVVQVGAEGGSGSGSGEFERTASSDGSAVGGSSSEGGAPSFAFVKLVETAQHNIFRISLLWDIVASHLLLGAADPGARTRNFGLSALVGLSPAVLAYATQRLPAPPQSFAEESDDSSGAAVDQKELLLPLHEYLVSEYSATRVAALQSLLVILQTSGQYINSAWPTVLSMVGASISTVSSSVDAIAAAAGAPGVGGDAAAAAAAAAARSPGKGEAQIVRLGFKCLDLVTDDFLTAMTPESLCTCMSCLGRFGAQVADVNIALTAINKISTVGDFAKHRAAGEEASSSQLSSDDGGSSGGEEVVDGVNGIWISMVRELAALSRDPRPEVRNCALQTLFSSIMAHSSTSLAQRGVSGVNGKLWERCLVDEVFPLVTAIAQSLMMASSSGTSEVEAPELGRSRNGAAVLMVVHHSRNTAEKQWNETVVLALGCMTRVLRCTIQSSPGVENLLWFSEIWQKLLSTLGQLVLRQASAASSEKMEVELAAIATLQEMMAIAVTRGSPPSNDARYSTSMRVVDGALTNTSPAAGGSAGKKRRRPALVDKIDAPAMGRDPWSGLWDSAWQLCEGVGKSIAVVSDDEERVATALAQAMGTVYESGAGAGAGACRALRAGPQVIRVLALMQGILARLNTRAVELAASGSTKSTKPAMCRKFKRVTPFEDAYLKLVENVLPLEDDAWVQVMLQLSQHVSDSLLDRTSDAAAGEPFASAAFSKLVVLFKAAPAKAQVVCFGSIMVFVSQLLDKGADIPSGLRSDVLRELDGMIDVGFSAIVNAHGQASVSREQLAHLWMQLLDTVQLVLESAAGAEKGDDTAVVTEEGAAVDEGRVVTMLLSTCMQSSDVLMRTEDPLLTPAKEKLVRVLGAGVGAGGTRHTWPIARRCLDFLIRMCGGGRSGRVVDGESGADADVVAAAAAAASSAGVKDIGEEGDVEDDGEASSELGALAFPVLLRQCRRVLLQCYASATTEEGEGGAVAVRALGDLRTAQLCFILEELAQLQIDPTYVEKAELSGDEGWSTTHQIRVTTGRRAHLLLLYPVFCELCILQSLDVQVRLRQVMQIAGVELGLL